MKTKLIVTGLLLATIFNSCTAPKYIPYSNEIDINQYGSSIIINQTKGAMYVRGELIAIDNSKLIVLTKKRDIKQIVLVPVENIRSFKIRYAQPKNYGWTIPTFILASFSHGIFSLLTIPINLIVTISVTSSGAQAFQYSDKQMTYQKLKMFARFPQGIPSNVDLANIQ